MKDQLVGTWTFVSAVGQRDDGTKADVFGANPMGVIIFANDGYFSLLQSRDNLPKLLGNDRAGANPDEASAILEGSIAYYGTYSVGEADKVITVRIEGSTFPNLIGPEQKADRYVPDAGRTQIH